jgi:hypothetical protein
VALNMEENRLWNVISGAGFSFVLITCGKAADMVLLTGDIVGNKDN